MNVFSGLVIGVFFISTVALTSTWYFTLKQFNGIVFPADEIPAHLQSHHIKDLILVSTILTSVVAFVTLARGNEYVHKFVLTGPIGNGVVMAHVSLATFLVSIAWFDGFNLMTDLNPLYKSRNYHTLYNNLLPTFALVSTYILQGLVVSANYVNNGMIREDSLFMGKREHHHTKRDGAYDGAYYVNNIDQPSAPVMPFRARVVCS
jgi:hypothetical protein